MKPLVTIILPVYNGEKTIERCIKSLLNQTLREIEIIIINDGSTDNTRNLVETIAKKDNRIKIVNKNNEGQGIARNVGIKKAIGKYIGFVDADDTVDENMYKVMLEKAIATNAELVQCNIMNIFSPDKYNIQLPRLEKTVNVTNRKKYFDQYIFRPKHSYECCNKLIEKVFLIDNNILFESNKIVFSEDLLFNLNIALKMNTITFIDNPFYNYYQYKDSHSKRNRINKIDKLCVLFEIFYKESKKLKYETSKIAILIIMINLSHILDTEEGIKKIREIVVRKDIKKYLFLSFLKMKKIRHNLLMLSLLCMPIKIKVFIIKYYYTNLR